jgi:hypothetical protein
MTDSRFTAVEIRGAQIQIDNLTKLGRPVNPVLHDIAKAENATSEAKTHISNATEYPLDKVVEVYFSSDVEADGSIPGPFSMSSVGMVACSYRTKSNKLVKLDLDDPQNCFYAELKPISENFNPEAAAVAGLDRAELIRNGSEPVEAMDLANDTITTLTKSLGAFARPVFVGYPLGFDWMFVYWYLMNFAKDGSPFAHSSHLDIKTLYAEKAGVPVRSVGKRSIPKHLHSKRKHTHNALDDAREQGDLFNNVSLWVPEGSVAKLTEGFAEF